MSERKIFLRIIDVFVVLAGLHCTGLLFNFDYFLINEQHWLWSLILAFYLLLFATIFELYNLNRASRINATLRSIFSTTAMTSLVYLLTPFFTPQLPQNRLQILYFTITIAIALIIWRALYIKLFASSRFNKNILLVGNRVEAERMTASLKQVDPHFNVIGFINTDLKVRIPNEKGLRELHPKMAQRILVRNGIKEIIVGADTDDFNKDLYDWLLSCMEKGYHVRDYIMVYEDMTDSVPLEVIGRDFYRHFPFSRSNQNQLYRLYHRVFDIIASLIGLTIGLVFLPLILIGNLIGNRGPLFYFQERLGKNRKPFKIIKYRSMVTNAEAQGAQFAQKNDARITAFGKFLRKSRLDEFPQFINILKGEMSIIGPRPERPMFTQQLAEKIPYYETRTMVKPGLTGWAQVRGKYGETDDDHREKLRYDLYYIKKRSVSLDLRIIVKTLSTIVFFKGQ
ncbi:sugar transferase [Nonlabens spongiae]|uniref:Sugar transferase n=1 Tax=Nonlabens spongiae TaxID=331648 RepID=A0A1W6MPG4_9FLAO|nr:sugar transferase [Nonlabens spongiae]